MLRNATRVLIPTLALAGAVAAVVAATSTGSAQATGPSGPVRTIDHTSRVVVRPVTSVGTPAHGYTVHREAGSASCGDQAATSYDAGVDVCYPTALYLPSCWKSSHHTALCLRHTSDKALVRIRYTGGFTTKPALAHKTPQRLRLVGGGTCDIRIGGAWGAAPGHPTWLGFYACSDGAVYGPPNGDGVNRARPVWRVRVLGADGTIVTREVARAAYVGTAH